MSDIKKLLVEMEEAGKPTGGERDLLIKSLVHQYQSALHNGQGDTALALLFTSAAQELERLQEENAELKNREHELVSAIKDIPDKVDPSLYLKGLDRPTEFAISQAKTRAIGAVMDKVRSAKKLTKRE